MSLHPLRNPRHVIEEQAWNFVFIAFSVLSFLTSSPAQRLTAQDGKILDEAPMTVDQKFLSEWNESNAGIQDRIANLDFRSIFYESDGLRIHGFLVAPKNAVGLPCIIYNRGGNRDFGEFNEEMVTYFLGEIASWGYVVVASQLRGSSKSQGHDEFGGTDVNDVMNLLPLVDSLPQVDAQRIGMVGWSRGGLMTYKALTRTKRIKAAFVGAGVADTRASIPMRPDMVELVYKQIIPNFESDQEAAMNDRSPVLWAEKMHAETPILIVHAADDSKVSPFEALAMSNRLVELKRPVRLVLFEDGEHGIRKHRDEVNRLTQDWFDRYLRDAPASKRESK